MTVYAWARPRKFPDLPAPVDRCFEVAADTRVMARCHWQADAAASPTLLLLHGLEGSSDAHYMRGMAEKAWRRGFNVVRLNQRNCGGTEHLSRGLYHSGLTADPLAVIRELLDKDGLSHIAVAGYSLGGKFTPTWMDFPMFYHGNPVEIEPDQVFFAHMILMDSDNGSAYCLGRTYIITADKPEPVSKHSLAMIVR